MDYLAPKTPPSSFPQGRRVEILLVMLLVGVATISPLPLYLASLAIFGLPHVIWELGYLRSRFGSRWTVGWWSLLSVVLVGEAVIRASVWLEWMQPQTAQIADLLALLLTGLVVVLAPRGTGWKTRVTGAAFMLAIFWALQRGEIIVALLLLSIAHNFTPLALAWDLARHDATMRSLAWRVTCLFALPFAVAAQPQEVITAIAWTPSSLSAQTSLFDGQLPPQWGEAHRQAWLSALVVAQCLHYYCVIWLLPQAQAVQCHRAVIAPGIRLVSIVATSLLAVYWLIDWGAARKLYAVAAGVHAWLEWPVILMAWTAYGEKVSSNSRNIE